MRKRKAAQQEIVQDILRTQTQPLLPVEILNIAEKEGRRLGIATIYRALRNLMDAGEAVCVYIQDHAPRYESTSRGHHHHFMCKKCNSVFDLIGCSGGKSFESMLPQNFQMEDHELTIRGTCAACSKFEGEMR